ncbi:MAG: hypothetical protein OER90_11035 [Gemmatimonadota bacterium]|nr:hypothetical protein [Gemmatimonadota bacterium]
MEDIILGTILFGGGMLFLLAISPVGKAIAERIRRGGPGGPDATVARLEESQMALIEEVEALRTEVTEVHDRLDFAERILLQGRQEGILAPGQHPDGEPES